MKEKNLTFKQKINLCNDLKSFLQNADLNNHPMANKEINNIIEKLNLWSKELRVRQLYYDVWGMSLIYDLTLAFFVFGWIVYLSPFLLMHIYRAFSLGKPKKITWFVFWLLIAFFTGFFIFRYYNNLKAFINVYEFYWKKIPNTQVIWAHMVFTPMGFIKLLWIKLFIYEN